MNELAPHCIFCDRVPHDALKVVCINAECRTFVCATNEERICCVVHISKSLPRPYWNTQLERIEFGKCPGVTCDGIMLGFEEAQQHEKEAWDAVRRPCDWHMFRIGHNVDACNFAGTHLQMERHVLQQHPRTITNINRFTLRVDDQDSDLSQQHDEAWGDDFSD